MISCDLFRSRFAPSTEDRELLEHVRACDACLAVAASADPDILFRSLGGEELLPPGGLDLFVGDVMREVRLRSTETTLVARPVSWTRRLAIAATVAIGILGGAALYQIDRAAAPAVAPMGAVASRASTLATLPAVQSYHSEYATIVEVPAEGVGDVQVVMVFDETLPADL